MNKIPKIHISSILVLIALIVGAFVSFNSNDTTRQYTSFNPTPHVKPSSSKPTGTVLGAESSVPVTKVVDGDTIKVLIDGTSKTVRLIGIDAPESVHPSKSIQCFGKEASKKLNEILLDQSVSLKSDTSQGDVDKYGRLLRYILLKDGINVNNLMIADGYAFEYTYSAPYVYQAMFKASEKYAKDHNLGLWNRSVCSY